MEQFHDILILGGGTGGITTASQLIKSDPSLDIAIVEPSEKHYYQPLWTLVGAGILEKEETEKEEADYMPRGVKWIKQFVESFDPDNNSVKLKDGPTIKYNNLVIALGIQIDWDKITGLKETLGKNGVSSNYSFDTVSKTWDFLDNFEGGNALFTFPNTPIKCGGAPQKIMWLAEHLFEKKGIRDKCSVQFVSSGAAIFGIQKYKERLQKLVDKRNIETCFQHNLVAIDGTKKIATFENLETKELVEKEFDFIHVTPPQSAPDILKNSTLGDEGGWVDVDKATLQHNKYSNIFSLGDASNLPTAKTGAAIRKQAPVLVKNLLSLRKNLPLLASYNGYTSCPLVTGYGRLILAEFDYDGNPAESFPFDQGKERTSMYLLKRYLLPVLYWDGMLKGRT